MPYYEQYDLQNGEYCQPDLYVLFSRCDEHQKNYDLNNSKNKTGDPGDPSYSFPFAGHGSVQHFIDEDIKY